MSNRIGAALAAVVMASGIAACGASEDAPEVADAAAATSLTGVYSCTIQAIDARVSCGGPVYTTSLAGDALPMSVAQMDGALEAGIWGKVLRGSVSGDEVRLEYRDAACASCTPSRPFIIELVGVAGDRRIGDLHVHMHQDSLESDCDKYYRGTCAAN